jgi:hypothetical protein
MSLPREFRNKAIELVNAVDRYNSTIETIDPGQRESARLNDPMRRMLAEIREIGFIICDGLLEVLKDQPRRSAQRAGGSFRNRPAARPTNRFGSSRFAGPASLM